MDRINHDITSQYIYTDTTYCPYKKPIQPKLLCTYKTPTKKVSREFIYLLEKNEIKNRHNCGLFNYIALISHAFTYEINKSKYDKEVYNNGGFAYLHIKAFRLKKMFGCKLIPDILSSLDYLASLNLIKFSYNKDQNDFVISLLSYKKRQGGWDTLFAERKAVYHNRGFVFIDSMDIDCLYDNASAYSDRDIITDMWLKTIVNDNDISESITTPVVYLNDGSLDTTVSYRVLARRWHSSVGRIFNLCKQFQSKKIICLETRHKHGVRIFMPVYKKHLLAKPIVAKTNNKKNRKHNKSNKKIYRIRKQLKKYQCKKKYFYSSLITISSTKENIVTNEDYDLGSFFKSLNMRKKRRKPQYKCAHFGFS